MGQQDLQTQSKSAWPFGTWNFHSPAPTASTGKESATGCPGSLVDLLRNVATRSQSRPASFDPAKMEKAFRERVVGLEFNLCDLTAEEERCIKEWLPEDWAAFQAHFASSGGRGIAYVELNAELVPDLVPGLQQLEALECVSVWSPVRGDSIDFGILSAGNEPLRINILGKPAVPLKITASESVRIEGREGQHPQIANSLVYRTNDSGVVNPVPLPLATPRMASPLPPRMPCVGDSELIQALVRLLQRTAQQLSVRSSLTEAHSVAEALLRCGSFDALGDFGFDLECLTPQQASRVQALPAEAWFALQKSAERVGEGICWVKLHDSFAITDRLVRSLNQLSPLFTLSVATPKTINAIDLGKLQGGSARLEKVHVRCTPGKRWIVNVPRGVAVMPLIAAGDSAATRCEVTYEDRSNRVARSIALP